MIEHLRHMAGVTELSLAAIVEEEEIASRLTSEVIETPIENLDLVALTQRVIHVC